MANVTVRQLDTAKPKIKPYKITVDRGLYLHVSTTGKKTWHIRYVIENKQRQIALPAQYGNGEGYMSLAQAVTENARVQALARDGTDTQVQKAEIKEAEATKKAINELKNLTVNDLYQVWLTDGVARKDGNKNLIRSFDKDVLPQIGKLPVRTLSEKHLRDLYKGVIARGVQRTAIDLSNSIGQMLRWAEKRQPWRGLLAEGNPAQLVDVKKLVSHDYTEERSRVLSENEIRELRDIFTIMQTTYDEAENKYDVKKPLALHTQKAVWLCLSTLCRIGELLLTEWRHVDFEKREWFIPQENSKGQRNKKQDQVIYLSDFALRQLSELKANATSDKWVFPSRNDADNHIDLKTISKQVGDRQFQFKSRSALLNRTNDDSLVLSGGQNGEWTPHDLRRTGATMMQALGVSLDVIDRCQNHLIAGSKVRRHYLHYDYHTEKREAWAKWGERIEQIFSADNLAELRGGAA
jgi:integrase